MNTRSPTGTGIKVVMRLIREHAALASPPVEVELSGTSQPLIGPEPRLPLQIDDLKARIASVERERDEALAHGDKLASRNRTLAEHLAKREQGIDGLCMGIARLVSRNAALERERDECDALRERMTDLLTRTTNALKGEPAELELHSWHDLPEVAVAIRSRIAALEAAGKGGG